MSGELGPCVVFGIMRRLSGTSPVRRPSRDELARPILYSHASETWLAPQNQPHGGEPGRRIANGKSAAAIQKAARPVFSSSSRSKLNPAAPAPGRGRPVAHWRRGAPLVVPAPPSRHLRTWVPFPRTAGGNFLILPYVVFVLSCATTTMWIL